MIGLKTVFLTLHVAGLVLGLGAAVFLDLWLLRFLRGRRVGAGDAEFVGIGSRLVALGLALLWVSGIGLLGDAWAHNPALFGNPKLHAKLVIVAMLTLNGAVLHALVLPLFRSNAGRPLFAGLGAAQLRLALACGAVSAVSWGFGFVLGMVREFNFVLPAGVFLGAYAACLLAAFAIAELRLREWFPAPMPLPAWTPRHPAGLPRRGGLLALQPQPRPGRPLLDRGQRGLG